MKRTEFKGQTALVACSRLVDFAGAEMATMEVALALSDLGFEVVLAAMEVGGLVERELNMTGLCFVDLSVVSLADRAFDLVWISHYVVAYHVLVRDRVSARHCFYSSLSHFEPLETPPLPNMFFSQYLVHSQENFEHFSEHYPHLADRLSIFPNAAPAGYFEVTRHTASPRLRSIGIVSNHAPAEVLELRGLLENSPVTVDLIGLQGTPKRLTPELIGQYDAVISIGKTVQYCLAAGIPVYCYDHFGGPGWIVASHFEAAFAKNFSGRCTPRKISATQILEEMTTGYEATLAQSQPLRRLALDRFSLKRNLLEILEGCQDFPFLRNLSKTEIEILSRESEVFLSQRRIIKGYQQTVVGRDVRGATTSKSMETFNLTRADWEARLAAAGRLAHRQEKGTPPVPDARRADVQLAVSNGLLDEQEVKITRLNHELALAHQELQEVSCSRRRLTQESTRRAAELERLLALSRGEFQSIVDSASWRVTSPLRRVVGWGRLQRAYMNALLDNSMFVLRQQGVVPFMLRASGFLVRWGKRKAASRQLARFNNLDRLQAGISRPLVSFVIPIHDRVEVLRVAVNSALAQTQQVFEVILVADGSPPQTLAVIEEYRDDPRVRIFTFPTSSGNAVRGRNKGILEARGRYIAFLDSDDIAAVDRLEVCLPVLESGVDVVYGGWRALLDGTREVDGLVNGQIVYSPECSLEDLKKTCVPCQSTVMVRRDTLLRCGLLKHRMEYREDHELWLRLAYQGAKFKSIPYVLTDLRLHAGNNELNFKNADSHWQALLWEEYRQKGPQPKKIAFLLAGLGISGGAAVALKHVSLLLDEGHDAFVIDLGGQGNIDWYANPAIRVYRLNELAECGIDNIDMLFSTFWTTVEWLEKIPAGRKLYLVQSDERLFYEDPSLKARVAQTYSKNIEYIGIAKWIVDFLRDEFGRSAVYLPNGIDTALFYPDVPLLEKNPRRPRVLIEGPISVPFKGVAQAYAAVSELDCELWIVSSDGVPEPHWRVDRFFQKIRQEDMRRIYSSCDILLKMSRIESFAYPPLEAMACGCSVVVMEVSGAIEYAVDGDNVLKVSAGDVQAARSAVRRLMDDGGLRNRLRDSGFQTVRNWSWEPARKTLSQLTRS